jgi:hypothetical protein
MLSREWRALIVVTVLGIGAMVCLTPLVSQLPSWVPQQVLETHARVRGYAATGPPPSASSGVNVMITGMVIVLGCIFAYFWWITRPLVVDCAPERKHSSPPCPRT